MNVPLLCAVLKRALDRRIDVAKCSVDPVPDRPALINITVTKRSELVTKVEASAEPLFASDRPIGDILTDWIGDEPQVQGKRAVNWMIDRANAFARTPSDAIAIYEHGRRKATPEAKPEDDTPENPQAPGSKLNWDSGEKPIAAPAVVPDPSPGPTTYVDPITNERRDKLTRPQMVKLGMTREQRHEQYRRQGGKHPDEQ